ncbi:glycosyltransferase family 9 protein [Zobellia uliginosa]|uniref:glycosyltransferase family 9 protein n=1 Tax=Zobellia uliginosa TaxID=143224 RepID=UPI001C06D92A|nr:glycosyltransferase family 9 protein [Zobellia uliginosa]MBU2948240.1 glycosyltransferase family 9 protein [Zobellia uliginosa]
MGDVAMTVPVLIALTKQYPNLKITLLTRKFFGPMFASLPNVSVFEADVKGRHKGVFGLYRLYKELLKLNIDAVADLHNVLRSKVLKRYFKFGGIPVVQIDKGRAEKKALTSSTSRIFKPLKSTHKRYVDVFQNLGFPIDLSKNPILPKVGLSQETVKIIGSDSKRWIGIAPFAAFEGKTYPLELMEEVIEKLNTKGEYKIFLFGGGPVQEKKLEKISDKFKSCISMVGKLSFKEELALISNLDVMLSMDSGNAHLAAMYGIPVVSIWGVTHPHAGFYPFGQDINNALCADRDKFPLIPTSVYGNKMPKGYELAMNTILPEQVIAKIESVLHSS